MNYANAARVGVNQEQRWNNQIRNRTQKVEELNRPTQQTLGTYEIKAVYFYASLAGDLVLIRRTLIQDVFKGKDDIVLKYIIKLPREKNRTNHMPKEKRGDCGGRTEKKKDHPTYRKLQPPEYAFSK